MILTEIKYLYVVFWWSKSSYNFVAKHCALNPKSYCHGSWIYQFARYYILTKILLLASSENFRSDVACAWPWKSFFIRPKQLRRTKKSKIRLSNVFLGTHFSFFGSVKFCVTAKYGSDKILCYVMFIATQVVNFTRSIIEHNDGRSVIVSTYVSEFLFGRYGKPKSALWRLRKPQKHVQVTL